MMWKNVFRRMTNYKPNDVLAEHQAIITRHRDEIVRAEDHAASAQKHQTAGIVTAAGSVMAATWSAIYLGSNSAREMVAQAVPHGSVFGRALGEATKILDKPYAHQVMGALNGAGSLTEVLTLAAAGAAAYGFLAKAKRDRALDIANPVFAAQRLDARLNAFEAKHGDEMARARTRTAPAPQRSGARPRMG